MTLRRRLTAAFLAVVLGPVLFGAVFAGSTLLAVSAQRSQERLDLAATVVRVSVGAMCRQLRAAADAVALMAEPAARAGVANQVVGRGLAGAVRLADAAGVVDFETPATPPQPWADCAGSPPAGGSAQAIAVRAELRDPTGARIGEVWAAQAIDEPFVARIAAASGVAVTVLDLGPHEAATIRSTEPRDERDSVLDAARGITGETVARADGGRWVRRVGPSPDQPLPLVLSVPSGQPTATYVVLATAVLVAGVLAVVAAARLARSTTRPLAELVHAVDRVADGDLDARVPAGRDDEVGRLADAFNRMARETQTYVQALTSSRDQLRGHLAVLGDTLASTHDLDRILRVILRSAVASSGASAGIVLLVDELTGTLIGQCSEGLPVPATRPGGAVHDPSRIRIRLGHGLLGRVAASGEPQRGRRETTTLAAEEPRCSTYVAVPFAAPDGTGEGPANTAAARAAIALGGTAPPPALGVLALYDRLGGDEFDDADLATLRSFARHAAIAVDNVRVHEEAQRLSLTDPLTGLWNYRYLKESIRREVERASRFGRMLSVLALDLDRFKEVNDTYGHAAGDAVLVEFARRIRGVVREVDLAFRQGGEEFVMLLPETDARGAVRVAERLGAAIRDTPVVAPRAGATTPAVIPITVSIGIAVYPDHATAGQRVLDAADDALYAAKAAGRDTYRVASGPAVPSGASSGPQPPRQSLGR